jgi:hypothetical protein
MRPLRFLRRFGRDDRASITVESVLIAIPILWWFAAAFVIFDAYRHYNVTVKASYALGDILSRQTTVNAAYLNGLDNLLERLTHTPADPFIRVSAISFNDDPTPKYTLEWSFATDGALPLSASDMTNVVDKYVPTLADDDTIILTQTFIPFSPAMNIIFRSHFWTNNVVTRPRFASKLVFEND